MPKDFERRLSQRYGTLSLRLQQAGDYIAQNPLDTASRTLRSVAEESGIAPATFSRLARALDYKDFEELRETMRRHIGQRFSSFSSFAERADSLRQSRDQTLDTFIERAGDRAVSNIRELSAGFDRAQLDNTATRLSSAENVVLVGGLGSTGIAEYACYMGAFLGPNWAQAGRMGSSIGSAIGNLTPRDAVIVITMAPYATSSIRAAQEARRMGAFVVVISASYTCPALPQADSGFVVPSEGQNFFSSYVATVFLLETLIALVTRRSGPDLANRIAQIEGHSRSLGEIME